MYVCMHVCQHRRATTGPQGGRRGIPTIHHAWGVGVATLYHIYIYIFF